MKAKVSARDSDSRETFRKEFKELNPKNKQASVVGKAGGEKWKSLTEETLGLRLFYLLCLLYCLGGV